MNQNDGFVIKKKKTPVTKRSVDSGFEQDIIKIVKHSDDISNKASNEEIIVSGDLYDELSKKDTAKVPTPPKNRNEQIEAKEETTKTRYMFNPDNMKPNCRFDYAKDLCKDYNESGYCVFGDTCIFLHDRGDYKSGWELDIEWNQQSSKAKEKDVAEPVLAPDITCYMCGKEYSAPILAECGHKFCEACALSSFSKSPKCPKCSKPWKGSFKVTK